jgi:hypothetical protein
MISIALDEAYRLDDKHRLGDPSLKFVVDGRYLDFSEIGNYTLIPKGTT